MINAAVPKDLNKIKSNALLHKIAAPSGYLSASTKGQQATLKAIKSEWEDIADELDPKRRQSIDVWHRNITVMNEMDDKADVREGISETKGVRRSANEEFKASLQLVPFEQNTKVYKMLKQQRDFMKQQKELKKQKDDDKKKRLKNADWMRDIDWQKDIDSEDELERHEGGQ